MKRYALIAVLVLLLPLAARADEASHKAKAEEMITILKLDRMVNGVMQNAMQQTTAITAQHYGGSMPPDATAKLADFQKRLTGLLEPEVGWAAMKPEFVRLFTEQFPEEQLDTMLAFYRSAAGKALLEKLPPIEQQVGSTLQSRVQKLQPQVRQMFDDFQKSLPAAGAGPTLSAPPAGNSPGAATPGTSSPK